MANKIYDFLPGHLQNSELETIFETTLERVFSKSDMEKVKAYVGRKEKGINNENDIYLSFPPHAFTRENYGLEPVFSSDNQKVFYEDLLNSLFNKGALTNDHRRLFDTEKKTVNIPIDLDKFINYSMYYWCKTDPNAPADDILRSDNKHYVTIDRLGPNYQGQNITNWWSQNNAWYHYDDIREIINENNADKFEQAKRPIIEFDNRIELAIMTPAPVNGVVSWEFPQFRLFNSDNVYLKDSKIFTYVLGDSTLYQADQELGFTPLIKSGDYVSEYMFESDMPDNGFFKLTDNNKFEPTYITTEFDYRNYRKEFGRNATRVLELSQTPKNSNAIDVYIDGIKQINNYSVNGSTITFNVNADPVGFVHVDICTAGPVTTDGDTGFQRIHHSLEYNIDNETYYNRQVPYSTWYEHFLRIVETTPGLSGEANGDNNYRNKGDNHDKLRHNNQGSVLVINSVDVSDAYFSLTRNDYDAIKAFDFLSTAFQGYKNKFITTVREILDDAGGVSKNNLEILEEAIKTIGLSKKQSISIFDNLFNINYGEPNSHYTTGQITPEVGKTQYFYPNNIGEFKDSFETLTVIKNGVILKREKDYGMDQVQIEFVEPVLSSDVIELRRYNNIEEAYIPPSATLLKINPLYEPKFVQDDNYESSVEFLQGHDGSLTPKFNDRTDDILLMFETLLWNKLNLFHSTTDETARLEAEKQSINDKINYGPYDSATNDWELYEKNYTMYPFFKKWMIRNNIDNLDNTIFDPNDWKTWNYRTLDADMPGHWRGIFQYVYNTDDPVREPHKVIGLTEMPADFIASHGNDFTDPGLWVTLFNNYNITGKPVPLDGAGVLRTPNRLFFNNSIGNSEISLMNEAWEFGDGSPTEMAWRRSSEYPFIEFILMMLTKPFKVFYEYKDEVAEGIRIFNSREGFNTGNILQEKDLYEFKLGSKLGGFVNNFRLLAENTSLNNSRYTDIPKDNFDLVIHAGEPNRSEFFSALIVEKVSLDESYPIYQLADTTNYKPGDIVLNDADGKYYKRKSPTQTTLEAGGTITFDYASWTMISQPNVRKYGYKIQGYDDINPTFFAMEWDKTSGEKAFNTKGDRKNLNEWQQGAFYRKDSYMKYEGQPYVCLREHTSTTLLDDNIEDWKKLVEWPKTNVVTANGYKEFKTDQIKTYNYGQILENIDDVAHLMLGYQKYLEFIGWGFTDVDEEGNTVDFEQLLYKFLEWSSENFGPGEFITLSPMLVTGSFTAPYGVASVRRETFKNFYRVVDASGRLVPDNQITFTTDGKTINFRANIPVYGMKIDIQDIEHAFVVDRVDSFGDVIYDPFLHNRNLRMSIDCNRSKNWDGTLSVDGFLVYGDKLIPNFETLTSDSKFFRDTLVDQNLEIVNRLKSSQIGYTPREYLRNHSVERESQLEFYKGFLSHKGTNSAVNRILNNNGNFKDIQHEHVWAFKISDYGKLNNGYKENKTINVVDMASDPHVVTFDSIRNPFVYRDIPKEYPLKTAGYVDGQDVDYTVNTEYDLQNLSTNELSEGDTAWLQFDPIRQWDVRRLSEVAEIGYVGETSDNQLYLGLTNQIDTTDSVYLKIKNAEIEPEITDYYYLVENGTREVDGAIIYEYLVFELNYEPLIVEIDNSTSNSLFVPTGSSSGVEAIGTVSYPDFQSGDTLVIDGESFSYVPGAGGATNINITGTTVDPIVNEGETARLLVYNSNGFIANTNTLIQFDGTSTTGTLGVTSTQGDQFKINDNVVTVDFSDTTSIEATTSVTTTDNIGTGGTLVFDSTGESQETVTIRNIQHVGSIANPTITGTKSLSVNGSVITFQAGASSTEQQTVSSTSSSLTVGTSLTTNSVSSIQVDNGLDAPFTLPSSQYSVSGQTINFSPALDNQMTIQDYFIRLGFTDTSYISQYVTALEQLRQDILGETVPAGGNADDVWDQLVAATYYRNSINLNIPPYTQTYIDALNVHIATFNSTVSSLNSTFGNQPQDPQPLGTQPSEDPLFAYLLNNSSSAVTTPTVVRDEPIDLTINLASVVPVQDIISTINGSVAPITASLNTSNQLVIDTSEYYLNLSGGVLVDMGLISSGSTLIESKLFLLSQDVNSISYLSSFINSNGQMEIRTTNDDLQIGGSARLILGLDSSFDATSDPTAESITNQINALNITGVNAVKVGSNIKIISTTNELDVEEVSAGALFRLGFATNPVEINAVTTIRDNINEVLQGNVGNTVASINANRQIVITSDQASIVLENVSGNAWNDIGMATGAYNSNTGGALSSAIDFKDQINSQTTNTLVSVSSDGRMIFTNTGVAMSFSGTDQTILDRIGLFRDYTAVTSNNNFKAMRWKSVRYSPTYLFASFDEFYSDLGLNAEALIWADDYNDSKWAVLQRSNTGTLSIRNIQADTIDSDLHRRVIIKDGENFYNYQLFDPLSLKMPGEIIKNLDYITWEDPAGYDTPTSKELWLDEHLGEIWWDTSLARYYRYNDYGDTNGRLIEKFASKYWGKLIPGSEINVKKWTKSETLPEDITTFTTKVYFDTEKNRSITEYFYWSEEGSEPTDGKTLSVEELKMLIESGNIKNKFIPISVDKILISNNSYVFENPTIDVCVEYNTVSDTDKKHTDWKLIQEGSSDRPGELGLNNMSYSLAGLMYQYSNVTVVDESMLGDFTKGRIPVPFLDANYSELDIYEGDATLDDIVVTVDGYVVDATSLTIFTDGNPANAKIEIKQNAPYPLMKGDIVRVYRVKPFDGGYFKNLESARDNFASSINAHFSKTHLIAKYPEYKDYFYGDQLALSYQDWYLTDEYKNIEKFSYLSKTRDFDMLKLYDEGVKSFKLELGDRDEYYFEHEGTLRLVNSSRSALQMSFTDIPYPDNSTANKKYYDNAIGVQIIELMYMLRAYATDEVINRIYFDMINYLYTEKTYPDWVFKTSYIDLNLFNRNLRKYAIYQRDSYDDVIDYITEAKPYHTKIREVIRYYGKDELMNADVSVAENMNITLDFGNHGRYSDIVKDGGGWDDSNLTELEDGTYEQGRLLRTRYTRSDGYQGDDFDTGLIKPEFRDSSVVFVDQYTDDTKTTHDKTFLFVYDMFGRGWKIDVKKESTASSFDGETLIVDQPANFNVASGENKKLIALRNETTGKIEFMTYNKKDNTNLTISDRGIYTGLSMSLGSGTNKVYVLGSPMEIVLHDMV